MLSNDDMHELAVLRAFFKAVAGLTLNHDVLSVDGKAVLSDDGGAERLRLDQGGDVATVSPSKLGEALEKVDKEWWKRA